MSDDWNYDDLLDKADDLKKERRESPCNWQPPYDKVEELAAELRETDLPYDEM